MDIVYLVRPGQRNEELRYSLRSLRNLPHDRVWIIGYCPPWVTSVGYVPVPGGPSSFRNTTSSLAAACALPGIADEFYLFSDDYFIAQPVASIPPAHRGPALDRITERDDDHAEGLRATIEWMADAHGITDPVSYDLHWPLPVDKAKMAIALDLNPGFIPAFHKRTFYGNYWQIGGEYVEDPKIALELDTEPDPDALVWSTMDYSFNQGRAGVIIRERFPDPSPYEVSIQSEYAHIDRIGRR